MDVLRSNNGRELCFSGSVVKAHLLFEPKDYYLANEAFVVNPGSDYAAIREDLGHGIPPLSSTRLCNVHLSSHYPLILLQMPEQQDILRIRSQPGWRRFKFSVENLLPSPELWCSSQDNAYTLLISTDDDLPPHIRSAFGPAARFELKLNLWFAPAGTHCVIHKQHEFMEIHTQIAGTGYMQKFHNDTYRSLYEAIGMMPGFSTSQPFCVANGESDFSYPWHQYYAETDCIWMAIEYHPTSKG